MTKKLIFAALCFTAVAVNAHTIIAILEAKPEKQTALKEELLYVASESRKENSCLEYRVTQDSSNPAQFVLFERWESAEAHSLQFSKPYITALIPKLTDLLVKPYQAIVGTNLE